MTTLDDGTGRDLAERSLAVRLRTLDDALDLLREELDGPGAGAQLVPSVMAEVEHELDDLVAVAATDEDADELSPTRAAIALRRDRYAYLRAGLEGRWLEQQAPADPALPPALVPREVTAPERGRREGGTAAGTAGRVMSIAGLVLVAFFLYQVTGSAIVHRRSQQVLLERFEANAAVAAYNPAAAAAAASDAGAAPSGLLGEAEADPADAEPELIPAAEAPDPGEPVAILQIPDIDVEEVVVQGTGPAQLRQGPGHLRGTPMPGEPGNVGIAGSRLANGGPFRHLDELDAGDEIFVTSPVGRFTYEVERVRRVADGDPDPVRATDVGSALTLVTSAPIFLASERLVVVASLQTRPVAPRFRPVGPSDGASGMDATPGGIGPVLGWGLVLAGAVVLARRTYRTQKRSVAYLLTTPVLLALLLLVFESVAGVLPATF